MGLYFVMELRNNKINNILSLVLNIYVRVCSFHFPFYCSLKQNISLEALKINLKLCARVGSKHPLLERQSSQVTYIKRV